jgi:lactate dehydrogenase-like 2-hydroxyacid dehydrogenase
MKKTVLVTRRVPEEIIGLLEKHFIVRTNEEDVVWADDVLVERAKGCFGILANLTEKFDVSVLSKLPELQIVANMAVGTNNIDCGAAKERKIVVSNTPDILTDTTADLALALMLGVSRRITEAERFLRNGEWKAWNFGLLCGSDLSGSIVGIVGFGRIGQAIAKRAHCGFNCKVVGCI